VSNTAQKQIRDAIVAALNVGDPLADGGVKSHSRRPMAEQFGAQVFVYLADSPTSPTALGATTEWNTRVRVECVARSVRSTESTPAIEAEDAADAIAAEAYRRIMADGRLGGLAIDTTCHLSWVDDESETALAACQLVAVVRHRTRRNDASIST
jgi:hypothetical protein